MLPKTLTRQEPGEIVWLRTSVRTLGTELSRKVRC